MPEAIYEANWCCVALISILHETHTNMDGHDEHAVGTHELQKEFERSSLSDTYEDNLYCRLRNLESLNFIVSG